ncbi:carbohydrate porin [Waterburya agarophytonicola K14]|uniref:Carbohydrate porin n=1 Tax=Waterburya agarophytonicola KI4 TaxID=2874699 RepID=A0A964FEP4_9CYAN|nr:iron uptake porin [Waterburya agarophytonicola]MCC0176127.1 carbohydrate porin [Waterburya agarophytonicola KI4]
MMKIKHPILLGMAVFISTAVFSGNGSVSAGEIDLSNPDAIGNYADFNDSLEDNLNDAATPVNSLEQVTNVNQLRDVAPTDWAYEALRSLVDRYGCISGFPNQTYRGNQPLSRYEFAAGLNSCLNQIERLIASTDSSADEDLETITKLSQEFEGELAALGGRIDEVESKTALLEDSSFSTTTKLVGEVAFTLANAFGEEQALGLEENPDLDSEVTFTDKVRLTFVSSFTGKDQLFTRITAGNIDNSFQNETGTREGRFAHDGPAGNNVVVDRLHYSFPVGEKLKVTAMGVLAAHHFYAEVYNDGLNTGGGATGALTRFGERNPLYRQGIDRFSAGVGAKFTVNDFLAISGGYIAPNGSDPSTTNGLFNGSFSALGQIELTPSESLKIGLTYVRGYDNEQATLNDEDAPDFRGSFLWGGTGTNAANLRGATNVAVGTSPLATNSFGAQAQFDITPKFSLRGWGGYTTANIINGGDDDDGSADIINFAGALVISDLIKEGSMAALIVGAEPYLSSIDANGDDTDEEIADDIPLHVEALYRFNLNDNISITPGVVFLSNPNQNSDNDSIFIGALRTTFAF